MNLAPATANDNENDYDLEIQPLQPPPQPLQQKPVVANPQLILPMMGSSVQQNTAAAFYARSRTKQIVSTSSPVRQAQLMQPRASNAAAAAGVIPGQQFQDEDEVGNEAIFDFSEILRKCPPPVPSILLKRMEVTENSNGALSSSSYGPTLGKVRVILRVANSGLIDDKKGSFFSMDKKKRQVTLFDPTTIGNNSVTVAAPKMFAFDGLFTDEDSQGDVNSAALTDTIHSVVDGSDGCLFCFGHANLGKTYTMVGSDETNKTLGIIPAAIAWLFRSIKEKKEKTNSRFSVRVSAVEIGGQNREELRDLLAEYNTGPDSDPTPPSSYFRNNGAAGSAAGNSIMQNVSELRCSSAEKAGQYLDAALTSRSLEQQQQHLNGGSKDSHFIYILHVYQYSTDKPASNSTRNVIGGRSRLHLIDFGVCERMKTSSGGITISGLGHVILGILNGQRHLPFKESPVTNLLKECLGSLSCQVTMLAHISPSPSHYSETLHTTQLASR